MTTTILKTPTWTRRARTSQPTLRFNPTAWAKLLYLRDYGETEVGGFAITDAGDLLSVEDVLLVRQHGTLASVAFEDDSVADFFDRCVDRGHRPAQFARIWVHTHPGTSPEPSPTDEDTFARVFGKSDWAVMFILACGGATYARLRFNVGPGGEVLLPVDVDYRRPFAASDWAAWEREYVVNVQAAQPWLAVERGMQFELPVELDRDPVLPSPDYDGWLDAWQDYTDEGAGRYDECFH